ncbi:MAG: hypothetical protein ACR2PH_11630 [Desulfobulbia bacterium]
MNWLDKTCENCAYNVNSECRKNPPLIKEVYPSGVMVLVYPEVSSKILACSNWRDEDKAW